MSAALGQRRAATIPRRRCWLHPLGHSYFLLVYTLVTLGLVAVFSASFPLAGRPTPQGGNPYLYFERQLLYAACGLILMLIVARTPVLALVRLSIFVGLPVGLGAMVATLFYGAASGSTVAWLPVGPLHVQPSELVKALFVIFLAAMLARGPVTARNWGRILLPVLGVTAAFVMLLLAQGDLGMTLLVLGITLGMALLAGTRVSIVAGLAVAVTAVGLFFARSEPYRWLRIEAWLRPEEHLQGPGYHIFSMLVALARGGVGGLGLGMSPDKWRSLPVPHTDSIFCVLGAELGLWGSVGLIVLMSLLALFAFRIAARCPHRLGWLLAAGAGLALTLQAFLNLAVAMALVPCTGLTLPFISAGGSSILSCLLLSGVVLAVAAEIPVGEDT